MRNEIDFQNATDWQALQDELLTDQVHYAMENSPFYAKRLKEAGMDLHSFRGVRDLHLIPVTDKDTVNEHVNEFIAAEEDIAEWVTTSGSTGSPLTFGLTREDLDRLAYNEARSLFIGGLREEDTVQITTTLDKQFMAGLAYYSGLLSIGAKVVRSGPGNPLYQWECAKRHRVNALIGVPSFFTKMIDQLSSGQVTKAICIGEALREPDFSDGPISQRLSVLENIDFRSTYACTESGTAFTECEAHQGGHLIPELVVIELLDENNQPVPDGQPGEVVLTPLGVMGMPLLRYKTGDIARLHTEACSCGRTTPRLGPIEGRKAQMIKWKGTSLYPSQLEKCLQKEGVTDFQIEISSNEFGVDELRVYVPESDVTVEQLESRFRAEVRVAPEITVLSQEELHRQIHPPHLRKPLKVRDTRNA